jgi:UDP-glucose 4-epimerase
MAILVTGGAGYIGSHTVRLLVERGDEVVVLDSLETGYREAVLDADLIVGDTRDQPLVARILAERNVDSVIHFAAHKAPGESMQDPGKYFDNNVAGALTLLQAMDEAGVRNFVFSSTCAVYGTPTKVPVDESHPLNPESPYGESKRMVEQMLRWYDVCRGLGSVSLRYFNAAGASFDARIGEDWSATTNLIPVAMRAACHRGEPLQIFGDDYPTPDGTGVRDYIHVIDLADAHARALDYLKAGGATTVLNLGTGVGSSVLEIIAALEKASSQPVPAVQSPRRPGDPSAVWADNTNARRTLGWEPQYRLDDIVATAWKWHSTHLDGYQSSDG